MAWLNTTKSGVAVPYAKRIKLTLDGSKIEEDLNDFPVLVKLSDESGILNTNVTDVFDELNTGLEVDSYTKLLLHMDDSGLTDSSPPPKTVTKYGNVTMSAAQSKFGGYSAYFDGDGDYLKIPDSDDWHLASLDFTIDCWIFSNSWSNTYPGIIGQRTNYSSNNSFIMYFSGSGASISFVYTTDGIGTNAIYFSYTNNFSLYTWYHIAVCRHSNTLYMFINGELKSTKDVTGITIYNSSASLIIGAHDESPGTNSCFCGYIDELRVSKGIARWTSDFTPPNQAYYNSINDAKKIAITSADGETQQYVEVEYWDTQARNAVLWTKCPTLASGVNTDLYLYYDKDAADNDTYVGETGSLAATNVWDDNFVGVFHLSQNPAGGTGAIKNSTQYGIHATSAGSMISSDLVDGKIGNGIDFDGSNDYLYTPSASDVFDITDNLTLECVFKWNTSPPLSRCKYIISRHENPNSLNDSYALFFNDLNRLQLGTQGGNIQSTFASWDTSSFYYLVGTYKFSDLSGDLYINGDSEILSVDNFDTMVGGANSLVIGANAPIVDTYCPGIIDEVRVSNTVRSSEWIKSTYYSNWDDLVYFYSPAIAPTYVFEGVVSYNEATLSGVQVRLYRRSTGELIDSSSTSASGTFYLSTPFDSEDHYVIALRDYSSINAIIADWVNSSNEQP